ncbi:hypothetical protein EV122DRAFT_285456, partial [Schizophyllum commune]
DDVDDEKLRAEFEPFGTITSCRVMRNERGKSKGFGFVCYSAPDEAATQGAAKMNNKMIPSPPPQPLHSRKPSPPTTRPGGPKVPPANLNQRRTPKCRPSRTT